MATTTRRAMLRRNSGTGFFKSKQQRQVQKGVPNGRYVNGFHHTKGRAAPTKEQVNDQADS